MVVVVVDGSGGAEACSGRPDTASDSGSAGPGAVIVIDVVSVAGCVVAEGMGSGVGRIGTVSTVDLGGDGALLELPSALSVFEGEGLGEK